MAKQHARRMWLRAIACSGFWAKMAWGKKLSPPSVILPPVRLAQVGERISTQNTPLVVLVGNRDALWLRPHTSIELLGEQVLQEVRVLAGQLLAVFGSGEKYITSENAVAGIRGTAVFWALRDDGQTYCCLCYGEIELNNRKGNSLLLAAQHHQARFIPARATEPGVGWRYAPFWGHQDEELVLLEQLCGRKPPFIA